MSVEIVITTAGRAAIVNAQNTGTAPVTIAEVGFSATAVTPAPTATSLPGEIKRLASIAGDVVADDTIHLTVNDASADAYSLRSFALFLADGTLFGIYGQADPIIVKTAASIPNLAIDVIFADISAASLTFGNTDFINPAATTERRGVIEIATPAEAQAGTDLLRALNPASAKAAVLGWLLTQDGSGSGLDADLFDGLDSSAFLQKIGGALSGFLTLHANPTADMHAAPRKWVQDLVAGGSLGFTPVNRSGDTMQGLLELSGGPTSPLHAAPKQYVDALVTATALLAKLLTVDGSGSGLDADTLDGVDWVGGQDVRFGMADVLTPNVGTTGGLRLRGNAVSNQALLQVTSAALAQWGYLRFTVAGDMDWNGLGGMKVNGSKVMHLANDGSGSGFDADMLDGLHASAFMRATDAAKAGSNANGNWEERANGFIEQWGVVTGTFPQGIYSHTWPRPYTDPFSVNLQITPFNHTGVTTQSGDWWPQVKQVWENTFDLVVQDSSGTASGLGYHWRAVGK